MRERERGPPPDGAQEAAGRRRRPPRVDINSWDLFIGGYRPGSTSNGATPDAQAVAPGEQSELSEEYRRVLPDKPAKDGFLAECTARGAVEALLSKRAAKKSGTAAGGHRNTARGGAGGSAGGTARGSSARGKPCGGAHDGARSGAGGNAGSSESGGGACGSAGGSGDCGSGDAAPAAAFGSAGGSGDAAPAAAFAATAVSDNESDTGSYRSDGLQSPDAQMTASYTAITQQLRILDQSKVVLPSSACGERWCDLRPQGRRPNLRSSTCLAQGSEASREMVGQLVALHRGSEWRIGCITSRSLSGDDACPNGNFQVATYGRHGTLQLGRESIARHPAKVMELSGSGYGLRQTWVLLEYGCSPFPRDAPRSLLAQAKPERILQSGADLKANPLTVCLFVASAPFLLRLSISIAGLAPIAFLF